MVGESLTTRLARERLAAIKKFIPVRDSVREQLQQRQAAKTDYSTDISQLFSPVTSATSAVTSAITAQPNILPTLQQIVEETGATKRQIAKLSGELQAQQEIQRLAGIEYPRESTIPPAIKSDPPRQFEDPPAIEFDPTEPYVELADEKDSSVEKIFTPTTLNKIRNKSNEKELIKFTANNFPAEIRRTLINVTHDKYVANMKLWAEKVYLANKGKRNKSEVDAFLADVKYMKAGRGIGGIVNPITYNSDHVTCPGNILGDVSRLQVLIGGKRAGNNSPEIINEASDICRRLFAGGVMDIHTYRELIEELVENSADFSD